MLVLHPWALCSIIVMFTTMLTKSIEQYASNNSLPCVVRYIDANKAFETLCHSNNYM